MVEFSFRVLRLPSSDDPEGGFHLFGKSPYHHEPAEAINRAVGKLVVEVQGTGVGVNLKIVDKDAWSDYVSQHVDDPDENGYCLLRLPDGPLNKRGD